MADAVFLLVDFISRVILFIRNRAERKQVFLLQGKTI